MNNKPLIFLFVAIVAIGFFVLPNTLAMFAGQHSWYDPNDDGIPCEKCHFLEAQEMSALVGPHTGETGYDRMECTYCHRGFDIGTNNIDSSFTSYLDNSYKVHAGQTLPCMYCHSGADSGYAPPGGLSSTKHDPDQDCIFCHEGVHGDIYDDNDDCRKCHVNASGSGAAGTSVMYITPAKGFGLTENATDKAYNGNRSVHTKFVQDAKNMSILEDSNEACLGCHTTTRVNISWTRLEYIAYDVTANSSGYVVSINNSAIGGANVSFMSS
ncbi:MAG: cytochrome c3 family protein [Methanosarcinaceae archaeon]|nr:cytochrome c3 family protein [Methanosarcinaceae archaeon]